MWRSAERESYLTADKHKKTGPDLWSELKLDVIWNDSGATDIITHNSVVWIVQLWTADLCSRLVILISDDCIAVSLLAGSDPTCCMCSQEGRQKDLICQMASQRAGNCKNRESCQTVTLSLNSYLIGFKPDLMFSVTSAPFSLLGLKLWPLH